MDSRNGFLKRYDCGHCLDALGSLRLGLLPERALVVRVPGLCAYCVAIGRVLARVARGFENGRGVE